MAALGPKARALIESGRSAYRPQGGDRARIEAALRARLGAEVLPSAALSGWHILGGTLLGACLGATLSLWALSPAHAPQLKAAGPVIPVQAAAIPVAPALERAPIEPNVAPVRPPRSALPARPDPLSQEVALLARATRALGEGRATKALSALSEHQQRFPNGKLSEERRAAKAQALCALGRIAEGREQQAQLAPQSPAEARARQACDAAARGAGRMLSQ